MWYSSFIKTSANQNDVKYLGKLSDRLKRTGIPPYLANMFGFYDESQYGDPDVYQSGETVREISGGEGKGVFVSNPKVHDAFSSISTDPYLLFGDAYNQPMVIHETSHVNQPDTTKYFDSKGIDNKGLLNFGYHMTYILEIKENIANFNALVFNLYNNPQSNISYILSIMFSKYHNQKTIFNNMLRVFLIIMWQEIKKVYDNNYDIKEVILERDDILYRTRSIFVSQYLASLLKNIQNYYKLSEGQIVDFASRIGTLTGEEFELIGENYHNENIESPINRETLDDIMNLEGKRRMMDLGAK